MAVLLISYDHLKTGADSKLILGVIQEYKHVKVSAGTYAIETHERTRTIFNRIIPHLSEDFHLLVVTLIKPFSGPVRKPASMWLAKHLPEA